MTGQKLRQMPIDIPGYGKKSCVKNRQKVFDKISLLIDAMNLEVLGYLGIKFEKREAYAVDYVSELLTMYKETTGLDETSFVSGRGHRKSIQQKQYEELHEYLERLKSYAYHIETCGEEKETVIPKQIMMQLSCV